MTKHKKPKPPKRATKIPADYKPDDLEVTTPTGGLERMIKIWEASRDANTGGFGDGDLVDVRGWGLAHVGNKTCCSPFTGTTIAMMFDPDGGEDMTKVYAPMFRDGKTPLPCDFYLLHQGAYFHTHGPEKLAEFAAHDWPICNDAAASTVFFNLGYEIDPRDMRRGDLVFITWTNGDGHATFCWDVHLDASGAVDCFSYAAANGNDSVGGVGVSIRVWKTSKFFKHHKGTYTKISDIFVDKPENIELASWYCIPQVMEESVDRKTFKAKPHVIHSAGAGHSVGSLQVVRFYGFPPPDAPHGTLPLAPAAAKAREVAKWPLAESYATGTGTPANGTVAQAVPSTPVPKSSSDPVGAAPPAPPSQQPPGQVVGHQHFVEDALAQLHAAGWLARGPGQTDSIADADTRAAVEEFQQTFGVPPVDGIAGPATRKALIRALDDLHAGKPRPGTPPVPTIDDLYWVKNYADAGEPCGIAIHGAYVGHLDSAELTLTNHATTKTLSIGRPSGGPTFAMWTFALPPDFGPGSMVTARLRVTGGGTTVEKASDVTLYVGPVVILPRASSSTE